jgi:hypothetical protein
MYAYDFIPSWGGCRKSTHGGTVEKNVHASLLMNQHYEINTLNKAYKAYKAYKAFVQIVQSKPVC